MAKKYQVTGDALTAMQQEAAAGGLGTFSPTTGYNPNSPTPLGQGRSTQQMVNQDLAAAGIPPMFNTTPTGLPRFSSSPTTVRGATTYSSIPGAARAGDILLGSDINQASPELAALKDSGAVSPYGDVGFVFNKDFDSTGQGGPGGNLSITPEQYQARIDNIQNLVDTGKLSPEQAKNEIAILSNLLARGGSNFSQAVNSYPKREGPAIRNAVDNMMQSDEPGFDSTTPIPTAPGQPSVPYNYSTREITPQAKQQATNQLLHQLTAIMGESNLPQGTTLDYYRNAFQFGGYTAQDIANDWTELQNNQVGNTLGNGRRIVSPTVQRWHWIVGGGQPPTGGASTVTDALAGTETGTETALTTPPTGQPDSTTDPFGQFNLISGDLELPEETNLDPYNPVDLEELTQNYMQDDALLRARLESNDQNYQNLITQINQQYDALRGETILKGDQARKANRSYLQRLGALGNTTAAAGFLNGIEAEKDAAVRKVADARQNALLSAYTAWQDGNMDALEAGWKRASEIAFGFAEQAWQQWESRAKAEQLSINDFQARTNYVLGFYDKELKEAGLNLDAAKLAQSAYQFSQQLQLDQSKFDFLVDNEGWDRAVEWAELTGYYVDPQTGQTMPTADHAIDLMRQNHLGGGGGGTGAGSIVDAEGNVVDMSPYIYQDSEGQYQVDREDLDSAFPQKGGAWDQAFRAAMAQANGLNTGQAQVQEASPEEGSGGFFSGGTGIPQLPPTTPLGTMQAVGRVGAPAVSWLQEQLNKLFQSGPTRK